jgi:probable addiction module antidote protein
MKASASYHADLLRRLKNPKFAAAYLSACVAEDKETFLLALRDVAEARGGVGALAAKAHLNREHLFRLLSKPGNPRLDSLQQLIKAIGLKLTLQPV